MTTVSLPPARTEEAVSVTEPRRIVDCLDEVRDRVRRAFVVHGVSRFVMTFVLLTVALIGLDSLMRWQSSTIRWIASGVWLAGCVVSAWFWVWQPAKRFLPDELIAELLESRYPFFRGSLLSATEFTRNRFDRNIGSAEFQQLTTERVEKQLRLTTVEQAVPISAGWRSVLAAGVLLAGIGFFAGQSPVPSLTGIARLAIPWDTTLRWPLRTRLRFIDRNGEPLEGSLTAVAGETLTLWVRDEIDELPTDLRLEVIRDGSRFFLTPSESSSVSRRTNHVDPSTRTAMFELPMTVEDIEVRPLGGDHPPGDMLQVTALIPAEVQQFRWRIHPPNPDAPDSNDRPWQDIPESVEVWEGSRIELRGRVDRPLRSAKIEFASGEQRKLTLATDRKRFRGELLIDSDLPRRRFRLAFVATDGAESRPDFETTIEILGNSPPDVHLTALPERERRRSVLSATPAASLGWRIVATDDTGLESVKLRIEREREDGSWEGVEQIPIPFESPGDQRMEWSAEWSLERFGADVDDRLRFTAIVTDTNSAADPNQPAESPPILVVVLSPAEMESQLTARYLAAVERFASVLPTMRAQADRLRDLDIQWEEVGSLRADERASLREMEQFVLLELRDRVLRGSHSGQAIRTELESVRETLDQNQLPAERLRGSLSRTLADVRVLESRIVPRLVAGLAAVLTGERGPRSAVTAHRATLEIVEGLVAGLSGQKQRLDADTALRELSERHATAIAETRRLLATPGFVGVLPENLSAQQTADLRKLRTEIESLGEFVDRFERSLSTEPIDPTESSDGSSGDRLALVRETWTAARVRRRLSDITTVVGQNRLGDAVSEQDEITRILNELRSLLKGNLSDDLDTRIRQLTASLDRLTMSRTEFIEQSATVPPLDAARLTSERRSAAENVDAVSRLVRRYGSSRSADQVAELSDRLRDPEATPLTLLEGYERAITTVRKELASLIRERQLAEFKRLLGELDQIANEHAALVKSMRELADQRGDRTRWSRSLLRTLRDLEARGEKLADRLAALSKPLEPVPDLALAVAIGRLRLQTLAAMLGDRRLDEAVLAGSEQSATSLADLHRLTDRLLTAASEQPADRGDLFSRRQSLLLLRDSQRGLRDLNAWVSRLTMGGEPTEWWRTSGRAELFSLQQRLLDRLEESLDESPVAPANPEENIL